MDEGDVDQFLQFAAELADGERWRVVRAEGWEDFEVRLAATVADLPVRRRQALIMLLFALVEEIVSPGDVRAWMEDHDVGTEAGLEAAISWLRERRNRAIRPGTLDAMAEDAGGRGEAQAAPD